MTGERILALIGLLLALVMLARFGPGAWRSWLIYAGVRGRRLADASGLRVPPPAGVAVRLEELGELGFVRIGERSLELPGTPMRYEWNVRDETGSTYGAVVPSTLGAFVAFYSSFDDGTWVQTNFPRGAVVERPKFFGSFVSSSLGDALATHRRQLDLLRSSLGVPRPVLTMADTLRMDADYRSRFGGITLRRLTLRIITPALAAAGLAVIFGLLLLLGR